MEKLTYKTHRNRPTIKKDLFLIVMAIGIFLILCVNMVSSLNFDNIKGDLIIDNTTSRYGKVIIKDWFGLLDLATLELKENTDTCGLDCSMRTEIIMYQDGVLIDDVRFRERDWDDTWHDLDLKDYKFYVKTDGTEWQVEDYREECSVSKFAYPNGTFITTCKDVLTGTTHREDDYTWEEYVLGTKVDKGTFLIKLEATRPSAKWVDWIIKTQGEDLDFWYTWGELIQGPIMNAHGAGNGIASNGSLFLVADNGEKNIYKYYMNYTQMPVTAWTPSQWVSVEHQIGGIVWNGSHWFIMDTSTNVQHGGSPAIHIYNADYTFYKDIIFSDGGTFNGLTLNKSRIWVQDSLGQDYLELDYSGNIIREYTGITIGLMGIVMNGSNLFIAGPASTSKVHKVDFAGNVISNFALAVDYPFGLTLYNESFYATDNLGVYRYFNAPDTAPASTVTTTLNEPVDYYNSTSNSITFNCSAETDGVGGSTLANITLWLNQTGTWILNETAVASGTTYFKEFTKNIPDGLNHEWTCIAYDDDNQFDWATNRTFTVDTVYPQLLASITNPIIYTDGDDVRVQYNVTDTTLQHCWYSYNNANASFSCASGVNAYTNITSASPATAIVIYANDTNGWVNKTSLSFAFDSTAPTITINLPNATNDFGYVGKAEELNWSVTDDNFGFAWYNYNGTNYTRDSAINKSTFYLQTSPYNLTFWANDTIGNQAKTNLTWSYTVVMTNESYFHSILEGTTGSFYINITTTQATVTPYLIYNGTSYTGSCSSSGSNFVCSKGISIPVVTSDLNHTFYWSFLLADASIINSTSHGVAVTNFGIDDCSTNSVIIMNLSLKEENNNTFLTNTTNLIEVELSIKTLSGVEVISYNKTWNGENNVSICINDTLTTENYKLDLTSSFTSGIYVTEFYHIDEGDLNATVIPIQVNLMDLLTADSTSFLFNYFDENGLSVDDIIIHVFRKYIGEGLFREVERSKQNIEGDTIVHLIEEDVIYYFRVSLNSIYLFTSGTYNALCDTTPCTITLQKGGEFQEFEDDDDWDLIEGGGYNLYANSVTREVNLTFSTATPSTFNLTVYKIGETGNYESVGSDAETGTSGSVSVIVPLVSGNVTFFGVVRQDDEFVTSRWIDWDNKASSYFGDVLAIFLASLIILSLGLMAISDGGSVTIVFVLLGLVLTSILGLIRFTDSVGLGILIYFVLTGGILVWKLTKKNR